MIDLGMVCVDNWVVGKEKGCYWLSNDIVGLVGSFHVGTTVTPLVSPSSLPSLFVPVFSFVQVE